MWSNPEKTYSYWGWSIVTILKIPFRFRRTRKVKNHDGKNKFIMEEEICKNVNIKVLSFLIIVTRIIKITILKNHPLKI